MKSGTSALVGSYNCIKTAVSGVLNREVVRVLRTGLGAITMHSLVG